MDRVWLGCGCFWSAEDAYRAVDGVLGTEVGFVQLPDGPVEVVQVTWDPQLVELRELLDLFFRIHDPTEDLSLEEEYGRSLVGGRSEQLELAAQMLAEVMSTGRYIGAPRTAFVADPAYDRADDAHQGYLARQRDEEDPSQER